MKMEFSRVNAPQQMVHGPVPAKLRLSSLFLKPKPLSQTETINRSICGVKSKILLSHPTLPSTPRTTVSIHLTIFTHTPFFFIINVLIARFIQ